MTSEPCLICLSKLGSVCTHHLLEAVDTPAWHSHSMNSVWMIRNCMKNSQLIKQWCACFSWMRTHGSARCASPLQMLVPCGLFTILWVTQFVSGCWHRKLVCASKKSLWDFWRGQETLVRSVLLSQDSTLTFSPALKFGILPSHSFGSPWNQSNSRPSHRDNFVFTHPPLSLVSAYARTLGFSKLYSFSPPCSLTLPE